MRDSNKVSLNHIECVEVVSQYFKSFLVCTELTCLSVFFFCCQPFSRFFCRLFTLQHTQHTHKAMHLEPGWKGCAPVCQELRCVSTPRVLCGCKVEVSCASLPTRGASYVNAVHFVPAVGKIIIDSLSRGGKLRLT